MALVTRNRPLRYWPKRVRRLCGSLVIPQRHHRPDANRKPDDEKHKRQRQPTNSRTHRVLPRCLDMPPPSRIVVGQTESRPAPLERQWVLQPPLRYTETSSPVRRAARGQAATCAGGFNIPRRGRWPGREGSCQRRRDRLGRCPRAAATRADETSPGSATSPVGAVSGTRLVHNCTVVCCLQWVLLCLIRCRTRWSS